jgi:hypothetical protein
MWSPELGVSIPTLAPRWAEFAMTSSWLAGFIVAGVADGQCA